MTAPDPSPSIRPSEAGKQVASQPPAPGPATSGQEALARRTAEEALRRSEERSRLAVQMAGMGTWSFNEGSGQVEVDARMAEIWGRAAGDSSMTFAQIMAGIHPEDRQRVADALAKAFDPLGDGYCTIDHRLFRPDGSMRWVNANCQVRFEGEGAARHRVAVLGCALDLTERKLTEEALARTQRALAHVTRLRSLGELAASIAHEINQPLAAIMTNCQAGLRWLAVQPADMERVKESLARAVRDAARAGDIIHGVRSFVKKTNGERNTIDINALVRDTLALARSEARANEVPLLSTLAEELPGVVGVSAELQQVLLNLLMNGLEAMERIPIEERVLQISTAPDPTAAGVKITVSDTGCGLADGIADTIFEAFYTTKPEGMGMGLAISRSIVEAHGGRIWATRNGGGGTRFQVWLPVAKPEHRDAGDNKNS